MARGFYRFVITLSVCLAAFLAAGCSGGESAESVSAAEGPILVETSQAFVTFQNRSGLPFTEVVISILPYGPGEYTRRLSRIENTMKREVPLTQFQGRDGTPFNLRVTRPKAVRVHAEDAAGKSYDVEVPWR
jgi:hypothetical protein